MDGLKLAKEARIDMGRQLNAIPIYLAMLDLNVTRQRVYQLVYEGGLELVKCGSFSFITNKSLANYKLCRSLEQIEKETKKALLENAPKRRPGRPRKYPDAVKD
jgi:hypothetical protein